MAGRVEKEYLCVVDGYSPEARDTTFAIDAPIQRHTVSFVREVGSSGKDSKPAKTIYTILDKSSEKKMMLLRAAPHTGRTHQIRLHAKECSLPIVGDDLYNEKEYVRLCFHRNCTLTMAVDAPYTDSFKPCSSAIKIQYVCVLR